MLPTASGTRIEQDIYPLATLVMPDIIWKNRDLFTSGNGAVVVFVQSIEGGNKDVLQAKLTDVTVEPDLVTGTETNFTNRLIIYPNPAKEILNIKLPEVAKQVTPVQLIDNVGRLVYSGAFKTGEQTKTISTTEFANGFYLLKIQSESGEVALKKVIITNGN